MRACSLNFVPYQPNQNLDNTICRKPKGGPKHENQQTVIIPRRLKKRSTRRASTKPSPYSDFPRTPIANELTTMLAASHYVGSAMMRHVVKSLGTHHAANVEVRGIRLLILRHSLNTTLLNVELPCQPLYLCIPRISVCEAFSGHCSVTVPVDGSFAHFRGLFEVVISTAEHDA